MKDLQAPCKECAFSRTSTPGHLGGSKPERFLGQIFGPFFIPCHLTYGKMTGDELRDNLHCTGGCAGSAVFRSNLGISNMLAPKGINLLPSDHVTVFSTPAEFLAHHKQISLEQAMFETQPLKLARMVSVEIFNEDARALDET